MGMPGPCSSSRAETSSPNPDPRRFSVKEEFVVGNAVVARLHYPDCTTYGGEKVLVYDDRRAFDELKLSGVVDPHFLEGRVSPVARFAADERGWRLAMAFAYAMEGA
jgi:hypothetical protein